MPTDLAPRPSLFPTQGLAAVGGAAYDATAGIVMRTRDRPLLLRRALASVLSQSFEDWRLCIVNDGGDPAIVERIVEEHRPMLADRVIVRHSVNSDGMEAASNRGLLELNTRYFAIHDDDDSWHPAFLHRTAGFLDDPANAAFIGAATRAIVINERIENDTVIEESRLDFPFRPVATDLSQLLVENRYPPIALLFRASLLDLVGGYNTALPVLGDWEFNIRAALAGDIASIDAPLAYYHHRHAAAQAAYGNTVTAGRNQHQTYETLLRNSMIRFGLRERPEFLGLLQPLLHAAGQSQRVLETLQREQATAGHQLQELRAELAAMRHTLDEMNAGLRAGVAALQTSQDSALAGMDTRLASMDTRLAGLQLVAAWYAKLLRPVRALWHRLLPFRRMVARFRGRI